MLGLWTVLVRTGSAKCELFTQGRQTTLDFWVVSKVLGNITAHPGRADGVLIRAAHYRSACDPFVFSGLDLPPSTVEELKHQSQPKRVFGINRHFTVHRWNVCVKKTEKSLGPRGLGGPQMSALTSSSEIWGIGGPGVLFCTAIHRTEKFRGSASGGQAEAKLDKNNLSGNLSKHRPKWQKPGSLLYQSSQLRSAPFSLPS